METLQIDRTKLMTVSNYAEHIGKTPQRVYQLAKEKDSGVVIIEIDGVKFVKIDKK